MKIYSLFNIISSVVIIGVGSAKGSTILLDSFKTGDIELQSDRSFSNLHNLTGTDFDIRDMRGSRSSIWTAYVASQVGVFNYTAALRGTPSRLDYFILRYGKTMNLLELMGADTLKLKISGLTGIGELQASFGEEPSGFAVSLPILGTGDRLFEFTNLFPLGWNQSVGSFVIKFVPVSQDFSITLDEITLIPEPSGLALLAGVATIWSLHPHRKRLEPVAKS